MKLIFPVSLIFLTLMFTDISCNKEGAQNKLSDTEWLVQFITDPITNTSEEAPVPYVVKFAGDSLISVKLDINSCVGGYQLGEGNSIKISPMACTKACCDSDFAEKMIRLLTSAGSYRFDDDRLVIVTSNKEIVLQKSKIR